MPQLASGDTATAATELTAPDGEAIPPGSRGLVIGWQGEAVIVEWLTSSGFQSFPVPEGDVRDGRTASLARFSSGSARGAKDVRRGGRKL